jgi:hypothetical protein
VAEKDVHQHCFHHLSVSSSGVLIRTVSYDLTGRKLTPDGFVITLEEDSYNWSSYFIIL